jgi:hypothetical protein
MSFALAGLALVHIAEGDLASASQCAWEAWMQNTLVSTLGAIVCWSKYLEGDFERALELVAQVRGSGGCGATIGAIEALALNQAGSIGVSLDRIEAIARDFPRSQTLQGALGYAYAVTKQIGKALDVYQSLEQPNAQKKPNNPYGRALVLVGLGNVRGTAPWLEAAFAEGSLWSLGFGADPVLRGLRGDPGFDLLVQKIGTPAGRPVQALQPLEFMVRAAPRDLVRRSDRNLARA